MSAKHKSHPISEETQYNTSNNSYYSNSNTSTINQTDKCLFNTALNWREIMKIDLRLIHQTNDLTLLEDLLDNLVYGNIKQTDIPLIPEVNILKLIKVYQFTLNYLLTTQDKLEERIHSLEKKNSAIQSDNITKTAVISKLKKELKKQQQHHHHQQQQTIKERFACVYCSDKYFDSKDLLDVHMERRHRINEVNEMKIKKREHKERVIEYKLDVLQKQFEEFYLQSKFRKGNERGKCDSMRLTRMIDEIDEKVERHIKELKMLCKKLSINNNESDIYNYNVDKVSMLIEEINTQNKKRIDLYHSVISKELANIKEEMIMNNTLMLRNQYYNYYNDNAMMNRGMNDNIIHTGTGGGNNMNMNNKYKHIEQQQQQHQSYNDEESKQFPMKQCVINDNNNQISELTLNNDENNHINNNKVIIQTEAIEIGKNNSNKSHSNSKQAALPSSSHIHSNNSSNKSQPKQQSIKSITDIPESQNIQNINQTQSQSHHTVSKDNNNNNDNIHNSSSHNSNSNSNSKETELTPKDLLTIFHSQYIKRDEDINLTPSIANITKQLT